MPKLFMIIACLFVTFSSNVAQSSEVQLQGELEARARVLFLELRCVVCQNQSIGDSDADVAKDLREIVREQISLGKSDAEIKSFLVDRYGEFILLKPVFALHTILLWGAPLGLLLLGAVLVWRSNKAQPLSIGSPALTAEEELKIQELIENKEKKDF